MDSQSFRHRVAGIGLLLSLGLPYSRAQSVRINELQAINTTAVPAIVDFEDYPDWIELHNPAPTPVQLDGYYLSDDPAAPAKWPIPAGAQIPAGGFLVIWADGHDAGPGESHPRGYWPWRNFTTEQYHANFSLSAGGETLVLSRSEGTANLDLITAASPAPGNPNSISRWRYRDATTPAPAGWNTRGFDDSAWPEGPPQLGYGDGDEATVINGGPANNRTITSYYRHSFTFNKTNNLESLTVRLLVDDGAVVYLNGNELFRQNMPAGTITPTTVASVSVGGADENLFRTHKITGNPLEIGTNVLAVEVHQSAANSSDISFDLGMSVQFNTSSTLLDTVTFPMQLADVTYGRDPADPAVWRQFAEATAGGPNTAPAITDLRQTSGKVTVSLPAGFYPAAQVVSLSAAAGEIHYTLDGSLPHSGSPKYTTPLSVASTQVLRTRALETGKIPGAVETRTYFIGEKTGIVPIISFTADPATLFDDRIGIYYNKHEPVTSGGSLRDVYKNKEVPSYIEYFEPGGTLGFKVHAGTTIGAENSWAVAQRPLNLHLRSKLGEDTIHYDLFPGSTLADHTFITLRNGGDNWKTDLLRDALLPFLAEGQLRIDAQGYRPSIVFINGAYYGIHEIRQKYDEGWYATKYRLLADEYDHLGYAHAVSPAITLEEVRGSSTGWLELLNFINTHDLAVQTNWNQVEAQVDIDSYIDFIVVESYVINVSWRHNREFWKSHRPGAKWQWLLPDIDRGFNYSNINSNGELSGLVNEEPILRRAIRNPSFKERLAQRFAAHIASTFAPARIDAIIDRLDLELRDEVPRHQQRWGAAGGMTVTGRANSLKSVKAFGAERPATMIAELRRVLGLSATEPLTLSLSDPRGGRVLINGVPVTPGVIPLFSGLPADLTAEAAPGYVFAGWNGVAASPGRRITLTAPMALTADFVPSTEHRLAGPIATDTTLSATDFPYALVGDLIIQPNATLTLGPGVELRIPVATHIRVQGALRVNGTAEKPVILTGRGSDSWGGISFENATGKSVLNHLQIHHATKGWEPVKYLAAIAALQSDLELNFVDILDSASPVFARGGSTILRDSRLHTPFTGDCINVKGGFAEVSRCQFFGNEAIDTDAIDFDSVVDGIIRDNLIYNFRGDNSDGIDLGEQDSNILVEGNRIYFNSDKGISLGQGSTAVIRRNLIVGCNLGIGVKDTGTFARVDQNTFVATQTGIAAYEKNFAGGGGSVEVSNSIFSRSRIAPVSADKYSQLSVHYSLSDTQPLAGSANLLADPLFLDPALLNYQLATNSPAIDAGDPAHAPDADGSRADMGAIYQYQVADYPFTHEETVVINEVLANSGSGSDWIELHNRSAQPMAIGGWFLSDNGADLKKYRIAPGTVITADGYLVLFEALHFGAASTDPGRVKPFALRNTGETVHLSSAIDDELTDYRSKESFGPSFPGVSLGAIYKSASDSFNFVALKNPTPGSANSAPRVGPVVISEIMYHPLSSPDAEFVELLNITGVPVPLYDAGKKTGWKITDGFGFSFPSNTVIAPGERIVLTQSRARLLADYSVPAGTQVFQWTEGKLDNAGETLQIGAPGPTNELGVVQFVRSDRVNYSPSAPWPIAAAEGGKSLTRLHDSEYGNTVDNWTASLPSPGAAAPALSYADWAAQAHLPAGQAGPADDPDLDRVPNLVEFIQDSDPLAAATTPALTITAANLAWVLEFEARTDVTSVGLELEYAESLSPGAWQRLPTVIVSQSGPLARHQARLENNVPTQGYFRLVARPR